ncbi:TPA: SMI1/KNR4 family protein [Vibrio parahaemolyticus]|nr:SMI1/KNR4 family protein [Vibrio parahaemolyticus]HAS6696149.1 SMI1/KNR4 family protein [Vibrio parahaemolyticus]
MFGKIFIDSSDCEYGVIRKTKSTVPKELSDVNVIAEDECGNYFILNAQGVFFWDHETSDRTFLSASLQEFEESCIEPQCIALSEGQVISSWIDPDFAKLHGVKTKP